MAVFILSVILLVVMGIGVVLSLVTENKMMAALFGVGILFDFTLLFFYIFFLLEPWIWQIFRLNSGPASNWIGCPTFLFRTFVR